MKKDKTKSAGEVRDYFAAHALSGALAITPDPRAAAELAWKAAQWLYYYRGEPGDWFEIDRQRGIDQERRKAELEALEAKDHLTHEEQNRINIIGYLVDCDKGPGSTIDF
jgi:hypothetical protein